MSSPEMPRRSLIKTQSSSLTISPHEKPSWEKMLDELNTFKAQKGHCNVSMLNAPNKYLGRWVNMQRESYKRNALRSNQLQQLNSIGFIWDLQDHSWKEKFDHLCAFKALKGHCNVSTTDERNKSLGKWVNTQRVLYKKNVLSSNRLQQLNSIGFTWDPLEHTWNTNFDQLCAFKAKNGHCCVSQSDERNTSLGVWVGTQRISYKKNTLSSN
eukprot:13093464-Ditylum_brightwellii.AAC.1